MLPILQIVETDHRNDKVGEKSIYIYIYLYVILMHS